MLHGRLGYFPDQKKKQNKKNNKKQTNKQTKNRIVIQHSEMAAITNAGNYSFRKEV